MRGVHTKLTFTYLCGVLLGRGVHRTIIPNYFGRSPHKANVIDPEMTDRRIIGGSGNRQRNGFADRTSQING